jgi:hypothetical protein
MEIHNDNSIQHCSCICVIRGRECVPDGAESPGSASDGRLTAFIRDTEPALRRALPPTKQGNVFGGFIEMQTLKNTSGIKTPSRGPILSFSVEAPCLGHRPPALASAHFASFASRGDGTASQCGDGSILPMRLRNLAGGLPHRAARPFYGILPLRCEPSSQDSVESDR